MATVLQTTSDYLLSGHPEKNISHSNDALSHGVESVSTAGLHGQKDVQKNVLYSDIPALVQLKGEGGPSMDIGAVIEYVMDDVRRLKEDVKSQGKQMEGLKEELLRDLHAVVKSAVAEAMEGKQH